MASFTMDIPNDKVNDLLDAFAELYGYDDSEGAPQEGVTKADFAKDKIRDYLREVFTAYKAKQAAESARQAAIDAATVDVTDFDIT